MDVIRTARVLYKDRLAFWLSNLSLLAILATWAWFFYIPINKDPLAVIHYNIYAGIDTIGTWHWLYIIPLGALFFSLVDFLLSIFLWTKFRTLSYYLLVNIVLINSFVFLYLYNILNYNS